MTDPLRHQPKPLIEEHYHIAELIAGHEARHEDRVRDRNQRKERGELEELIAAAPVFEVKDFWCAKCRRDFKAMAVKQVEDDWSNMSQRVAFYRSKCFCGRWAIRLVTDKQRDGYWQRSRAVAVDRGRHSADLLQPFDEGYNLLYGKPKFLM